jgi:transposase
MIPEAREVRISWKDRKILEARCRSPVTLQRDLKRARIVLLAAEGRSTRSIAKEVGVQPRIVSLWRHRFADRGLEGLEDKPRPGKVPIYTKATGKRILVLLDKPAPTGFARWTGPLLAAALGDVDVQYVWRFLRDQRIDLQARKSWCESNDPDFASKAADVVGLYIDPPKKAIVLCVDEKPSIQALERAQGYLKLPNGRALTGQSHDYKRHGTTTLFAALEVASGKVLGGAFQAAPACRVSRLHEQSRGRLSGPRASRHSGQSQHAQEERALAQETSQCQIPFHPDAGFMAQPGRDLVLHPAGPVAQRRFLHRRQPATGAHRCLHSRLQRQS